MKDSTKAQVNLGILLFGATLAATLAQGTGTAVAITGILTYLGSIAGNQNAKWFGDWLDDVPKDQQDIFRNHHLRTLVTQAAATVVAKVIAKKPASPTGTLTAAQKHIGAALDKALNDPKSPLAKLYDFNLPDLLTTFVKKKGKMKLFSIEVWETFLDTLPHKLWLEERAALAEALHTHFAEALWGIVKDNAAKHGEAAAAVEILYFSRILEATEKTARREDTAPLIRHITKRIRSLDQRSAQHFQNLFAQNKSLARQLGDQKSALLQALDQQAGELGKNIDRLRKQHAAATRAAHKKLNRLTDIDPLQSYYKALRDQFSIYENLGLPVPERDSKDGEQDKPIPIRKLFVAPTFTQAHFTPEAFDAALLKKENPALPLLPRLAPPKSRTILLADPGMGKSTLIQWLISTLADEAVPLDEKELRGTIPLPFILRDLVTHLPNEVKDWNWEALVNAFCHWRHRGHGAPLAGPIMAQDLFRSILGSDRAFFLIDGLDEIGDPQRRLAIRDALWEGFEKYPAARWLVTSRIVGYEQAEVHAKRVEPRRDPGPQGGKLGNQSAPPQTEKAWIDLGQRENAKTIADSAPVPVASLLYLAPFDDDQQLAFARNWYRPRLGEAAGAQRAKDFMQAVRRHSHTGVIGRVPNLLYLLALLFRHRARLPDGRALVYAAISSAYLADIDLGRNLPDSLIVQWKPEEKESLLAIVAMRMQEIRVAKKNNQKGEVLVTRSQLENWLGPRFGGATDDASCAELHRFLDHIAKRSGLLLPRGEGVFGFAHLSFQEYYAACHLEKDFRRILNEKARSTGGDIFGAPTAIKADEQKMFAEMAALPAWHEPLLFLVEKLSQSPPDTRTILSWTFPQLAAEPKGANWMPFNAARLLAGISLDQEVTLDDAQRARIWRSLWQTQLADPKGEWHIAPSLIVAGNLYSTPALQVAASLQPKTLSLDGCTGVSDLNPLSGLGSLQRLDLDGCTGVSDLKPLSGLGSLEILFLNDCTGVRDLKPLSGLGSLEILLLSGCTDVSDLKPLSGLGSLEQLHLDGCTGVSDLKPLSGLGSLRGLNLNGCTGVSDESVATLKASLPKLEIGGRSAS